MWGKFAIIANSTNAFSRHTVGPNRVFWSFKMLEFLNSFCQFFLSSLIFSVCSVFQLVTRLTQEVGGSTLGAVVGFVKSDPECVVLEPIVSFQALKTLQTAISLIHCATNWSFLKFSNFTEFKFLVSSVSLIS